VAPGVFPLGLEVVSPASGAHSLDAHPMGIQFLHLASVGMKAHYVLKPLVMSTYVNSLQT